MRKLPFVFSIASFLLAVIIFALSSGARSIYSGLFFTVLGVVFLLNAIRGKGRIAG
jgi:hypothetical protein